MSKASPSRTLVLGTNVIRHRYVHDWGRVILGQNHPEAVSERHHLVLELGGPDGSVHRRKRHRESGSRDADGEPSRMIPEAHTRQFQLLSRPVRLAPHLSTV
jgi:hypothetical protein